MTHYCLTCGLPLPKPIEELNRVPDPYEDVTVIEKPALEQIIEELRGIKSILNDVTSNRKVIAVRKW